MHCSVRPPSSVTDSLAAKPSKHDEGAGLHVDQASYKTTALPQAMSPLSGAFHLRPDSLSPARAHVARCAQGGAVKSNAEALSGVFPLPEHPELGLGCRRKVEVGPRCIHIPLRLGAGEGGVLGGGGGR